MAVVMGTAGHIDHGKTTLVKALTGIDCDRLAEEKKRGITIELGFAFMDMGEGDTLGVVDVPGHERFVKNMVAGASGIDFVLLVVAADEGVMPQTREHLEICSLLGIRTGLVALTKVDMVDEEWLELVQEDLAGFFEGTFLEEAPVFPVSAHTGQGVDELRDAISAFMKSFEPEGRTDLFRLPVDRVFTMRGHGTVVTGTLISGEVSVGEDVTVYPKGLETKIRGLQSHGGAVETAPAGRRTAVNLHGVEVSQIERGQVVARPGTLFPHPVWDLELTCLSSSPRGLKHRGEVHFHHGSKETLARLFFLDRDVLKPGETAVCQVRFTEPLPSVFGDRVVVRAFSPLRTVAGGRVLNPLGRKIKRFSEELDHVASLGRAADADDLPALTATHVGLAGPKGLTANQIRALTAIESKKLDKILADLSGKQEIFLYDKEERRYVGKQQAADLHQRLLDFLADYHKREPMQAGLSRGALDRAWPKGLPPKLKHMLIERALKSGEMETEGEVLRLAGHKVSLASDQEGLRERLQTLYGGAGATPPNMKDVLEELDLSPKELQPVLKLLVDSGVLVKVKEDMYLSAVAMEEIREKVRAYLTENEEMGPTEFRELTGLSRKFAIPYMEQLDKEKITVRVGDKRRLRKR